MTRRTFILPIAVLGVIGLTMMGSFKFANAKVVRADCPGKIVCPQTGELICRDRCPTVDPNRADCPGRINCPQTGDLVCRDRCPTVDPNRADCPGRIVCPLTGELLCKDRCPLAKNDATLAKAKSETPPCCASKR